MSYTGKIVGFIFGWIFIGPFGALFGAFIGHIWDLRRSIQIQVMRNGGFGGRPWNSAAQAGIQQAFLETTFSVMGHVCKADGRVSEEEIAAARQFMDRLRLDEAQRKAAIDAFNRGKAAEFDLRSAISQLRETSGQRVDLLRIFLEVQMQAAFADGDVTAEERGVLLAIADLLGLSEFEYRRLEALLTGGFGHAGSSGASAPPRADRLKAAYQVLGVSESASESELKKAYRRLMSQHHPDKLAARGLPEEMRAVAEEKTREITEAYELIKEARGIN